MQPSGQVSQDGRWLWNGQQWVPYQQPLTAVVPWARAYESARFRGSIVTFLLAVNVAALALGIVFDLVNASYLSQGSPSGGSLEVAVAVLAVLFLLAYYGSFIPSVIFFCMWLHRVVRNMPALGSMDPRWSPAGAVGRCFIPFLNLVHPLFGTLDAWRASDPGRRWLDVRARKAMAAPGLITAWWAPWLIGSWISAIANRLSSSGDTGTQVTAAWIDAVGSVVLMGAAWFAILVVRDTTARQDRKNALIASGQLA